MVFKTEFSKAKVKTSWPWHVPNFENLGEVFPYSSFSSLCPFSTPIQDSGYVKLKTSIPNWSLKIIVFLNKRERMKEEGQILQLNSLRLGTYLDNISLPWPPKFALNPTCF